jgi:hypothetical protein
MSQQKADSNHGTTVATAVVAGAGVMLVLGMIVLACVCMKRFRGPTQLAEASLDASTCTPVSKGQQQLAEEMGIVVKIHNVDPNVSDPCKPCKPEGLLDVTCSKTSWSSAWQSGVVSKPSVHSSLAFDNKRQYGDSR